MLILFGTALLIAATIVLCWRPRRPFLWLVLVLSTVVVVAAVIPQLDSLIKPISANVVAREKRLQKEGAIPAPTPIPIPTNESELDRHVREALEKLRDS